MYETKAQPPPVDLVHAADRPVPDPDVPVSATPGTGYDATSAVLPGPPPGTTTYRLRSTGTTRTD
jgi:hypothetical protein